jgi:7-cyano-7-deazaguanine reductase
MMSNTPERSLLGKPAAYQDQYEPGCCTPSRARTKRQEIGIAGQPPFFGADLWTAYELSWLTPRGKPVVAIAHVTVPCETPNIVESKSFKLYLNSFTNSRFASFDEVLARLRADLAEALWRVTAAPRRLHRRAPAARARLRPAAGARTRRPAARPARHRVHPLHARARTC